VAANREKKKRVLSSFAVRLQFAQKKKKSLACILFGQQLASRASVRFQRAHGCLRGDRVGRARIREFFEVNAFELGMAACRGVRVAGGDGGSLGNVLRRECARDFRACGV
jgi:hypothetical protein